MAYVQVEADEVSVGDPRLVLNLSVLQQRLEEGPDGLQFKCMGPTHFSNAY
jgi:hypothetical protein